MKSLIAIATLSLLTASVAHADDHAPSLEVRDRGDAVEIIGHNLRSSRTAVNPIRQRLEIALAGAPHARRVAPTDATIVQAELDGDDTRVLSVKLTLDRADVKALASLTRVEQLGADLHLMIPRALPADGKPPTYPAWTVEPAAPAAPTAPAAAPAAPMIGPPRPPTTTQPAPAATTAPAAATTTTAAPATAATNITAPATTTAPAPFTAPAHAADDDLPRTTLIAAFILAVLGGGSWYYKRRRPTTPSLTSIDVVAQRSLGNKAKVVWLSAGGREMVVAVTPQSVRMLGQWRRPGELPSVGNLADGPAVEARGTGRTPLMAMNGGPVPNAMTSPAVSGILKLRERVAPLPVNDEVATDDIEADALWAKEILAATGIRR
jgi:flagellar biogenesis protein FliO